MVEVKLETGKYGISLMDDENFNGKMDFNFIGIPKEGFGFSNYYHTGLTKPNLKLFEFEVLVNKIPKVEVAMKYMWQKKAPNVNQTEPLKILSSKKCRKEW